MGTHISRVQFKAICTFDQFITVSRIKNLKCKLIQANFNQRNSRFFFLILKLSLLMGRPNQGYLNSVCNLEKPVFIRDDTLPNMVSEHL